MRRAPPTTTRANLPGFLHFLRLGGLSRTRPTLAPFKNPTSAFPRACGTQAVTQAGQTGTPGGHD
jgi:hypothetical protein